MSTSLHYASVFFLMLCASAVPGPSDVVVAATALRYGLKGAVRVMLGIILGDAVFIFLVSTAWISLSTFPPELMRLLRMAGVFYLLSLSWKMIRSPEEVSFKGQGMQAPGIVSGCMITLSDPTAIGFYAALLPLLTGGRSVGFMDGLVLFACAACAISLVKMSYALLAIKVGRYPKFSENVQKASGILLAIMTLMLFYHSF